MLGTQQAAHLGEGVGTARSSAPAVRIADLYRAAGTLSVAEAGRFAVCDDTAVDAAWSEARNGGTAAV